MTIIDRIEKAMFFDSEDREKQSQLLLSLYEEANPEVKTKINECLTCLCGWSLETLLKQAEKEQEA